MPPTSASKYRIEVDGMPVIRATNADLPEKRAAQHTHQPGNQPYPVYGPANATVGEFTFRHATGDGNIVGLMNAWFNDYHAGLVGKRNARLVIFDRTGRTPVETWEMRDCSPVMIKPEEHAGGSDQTSEFSFTLQPEGADVV